MSDRLRWGILSTGRIASTFAAGVAHSRTGRVVAVGSRTAEAADRFGEEHHVPNRHASYEDLLADPDVDAVYIATPHPFHAEWAIRAAEAGKHILCEKPIGLNHAEAMAIIEAAHLHDVFLMEAYMYRCHPQTERLLELIREGAVGEVRLIKASFCFQATFDPAGRLFNQALGGGAILDVGGYCTSMARLIAGAALGRDFAEPIEVSGCGAIGKQSRVDEWAIASLKFDGGIIASLQTAVCVGPPNPVEIYGSEGFIVVPQPWSPNREGGLTRITVQRLREAKQEIEVQTSGWLYGIEADTVAQHLARRQAPAPAMQWDDTLGNMRCLDAWRHAIGMEYDGELPAANAPPVHRRPLRRRENARIPHASIDGIKSPVSRLVFGVDNQQTYAHGAVMFDHFIEQGGSCFDTAYVYGRGRCEQILGHWLRNRRIRDEIVLIGKGAHTPLCAPEHIGWQLQQSLERLQTDRLDIYFLHRDNPSIPVGEFVDALHEHHLAGRIGCYGASNWSMDRIAAANAYAREQGKTPFSVVSNNFSLARMVEPVWEGCISASDPDSRAWFRETQLPLFAWSSQARGFFVRGDPADRSDPELAKSWYSGDNFRRLDRARELARERGVEPIQIALAYVLCQPFPTFALIGPRTLREASSSLPAVDIHLDETEIAWLNLELEDRPA